MGLAIWLRSPRRTLTVFLTLMLVLGGALGWFGWQLLRQDRALEGQRRQELLEQAVDRMAALLQQSLTDLESYLSFVPISGAEDLPDGVSLLRVNKHALEAYPQTLKSTYGGYYTVGRVFVKLIGDDRVMKLATRHGLPHPVLMRFVLKLMANLTDPRGGPSGRGLSGAGPITRSRRARRRFAALGAEFP